MADKQESAWTKALDRWESEGGAIAEPSGDSAGRPSAQKPGSLPPGYQAQPAWGFRDPTGHYQFHRVYGPAEHVPGPLSSRVSPLIEGLSFWSVVRPGHDRTVSYHQAVLLLGPRLTFQRFASPAHPEHIRRLLGVSAENEPLAAQASKDAKTEPSASDPLKLIRALP